jgi:hypothetical protein
MATSGMFSSGEPNLPPIEPMLLKVMVPPVTSSVFNLLCVANSYSLDNSLVIYKKERRKQLEVRKNILSTKQ